MMRLFSSLWRWMTGQKPAQAPAQPTAPSARKPAASRPGATSAATKPKSTAVPGEPRSSQTAAPLKPRRVPPAASEVSQTLKIAKPAGERPPTATPKIPQSPKTSQPSPDSSSASRPAPPVARPESPAQGSSSASSAPTQPQQSSQKQSPPAVSQQRPAAANPGNRTQPVYSRAAKVPVPRKKQGPLKRPTLVKFRYDRRYRRPHLSLPEITTELPYRQALPYIISPGTYLDFSKDVRSERLERWNLPLLKTPEDLANWLQIPLGKLAWLTDRFREGRRPVDASKAHYHYTWKPKRRGGYRLIESPLPLLRQVQEQILDEILSQVPTHDAAHGFCTGRSVVTNAQPHVAQTVVVKLDLDNFYTRVRHSRVVAVYRGFGYSREVALWLARLTTSALPSNFPFPGGDPKFLRLFLHHHLPQGAPTSPALANLVAFSLDVRLAGLAKSFGANYTRYGDDLTFSGDEKFLHCLRLFMPLARQIIRQERFLFNKDKRKILRQMSQQSVTGVVVNEKPNISRKEFDRLKATLHNCLKTSPQQQNRENHSDFYAHLRGRIAYIQQLNPQKGAKLLAMFHQISW